MVPQTKYFKENTVWDIEGVCLHASTTFSFNVLNKKELNKFSKWTKRTGKRIIIDTGSPLCSALSDVLSLAINMILFMGLQALYTLVYTPTLYTLSDKP